MNKRCKKNWAQRRKQYKPVQDSEIIKKNVKFELYYRKQLSSLFENDKDYESFMSTLKEELPVSFRINPLNPGYEKITEKLSQEGLKMETLPFYPENLLITIPMTKDKLKEDFDKAHKFIQLWSDSGLITRQEVVSMIPPILLDVKKGHKIYDACASPGSKTAQLLEFSMRENKEKDLIMNSGFVIANDADNSRANMLVNQISRFNYGWIGKILFYKVLYLVNHDAQNFPTIYYQKGTDAYSSIEISNFDTRVYFDRIIWDVPCSSDAVIRKIPK